MADKKFNTYKSPADGAVTVYKQGGKYDKGAGYDRALRGLGAVAAGGVLSDRKGMSQTEVNATAKNLRESAAKDKAEMGEGYGQERASSSRQTKRKSDGQDSKGKHKFFNHDITNHLGKK